MQSRTDSMLCMVGAMSQLAEAVIAILMTTKRRVMSSRFQTRPSVMWSWRESMFDVLLWVCMSERALREVEGVVVVDAGWGGM